MAVTIPPVAGFSSSCRSCFVLDWPGPHGDIRGGLAKIRSALETRACWIVGCTQQRKR